MRTPSLLLILLTAGCAAPAPPPRSTPLPVPITTQTPIAPRLLPGQPPPPPEAIAQQQLQRAMRADQRNDQVDALDPRRPRATGHGDVTSPEVMGDPTLPVMPDGRSPIFRRP